MDGKMKTFVLSEVSYGSRLDELLVKLVALIPLGKCYGLKTLSEYFNVQMKSQLETATCYKDIIDVYFKQLFYFDILQNALLYEPYIKRAVQVSKLKKEDEEDISNLLNKLLENLESYSIYFKYLSNDVDIGPYERIKIRAIFKYFQEKEAETKRKLKLGYIINEMITREKTYISKLEQLLQIIDSHGDNFKDQIIGEMDKICDGHKSIFHEMELFSWDCDLNEFIECFTKQMSVFQLYSENQRSKTAEVIHTLPDSFSDELKNQNINLYMCIQHLMSYGLFFDNLREYDPDKKNSLMELKEKIHEVNLGADDLFAVANIVRSNVDLQTIGKLIARGKVRELKEDDHELFLFDTTLVITQIPKTEKEFKHVPEGFGVNPTVFYRMHIIRAYLIINVHDNNKVEIIPNLSRDNEKFCFTIKDQSFKELLLKYARG